MDWVYLSKRAGMDGVFPRAGRAALSTKPEGNPKEQPCQIKENPVLPDSFTQNYIQFQICFVNFLK